MAYLAELDTRLLLYIQDALRNRCTASGAASAFWAIWAGFGFLPAFFLRLIPKRAPQA